MLYTLFVCLWPIVNLISEKILSNSDILKLNNNEKNIKNIVRNMAGFLNVIGTVTFQLLYLYTYDTTYLNLLILYPKIYYAYDIYYIFINRINSEYPYIYHHLVSIYFLESLPKFPIDTINITIRIFTSAEVSNILIYPVYYFIKSNNNSIQHYERIINSKILLIIWYIIHRFIYFSYIVYFYIHLLNDYLVLKYCLITIYVAGIFWIYNQYLKLGEDIKDKNKMLKDKTE